MNRNFPPPRPPYRPMPMPMPAPAPAAVHPGPQRRMVESPYAPAAVLIGLIKQSENRYVTYRDLAMKQDRGFGQLQIDAQNLSIALSPRDPEAFQRIQMYLDAALGAAEHNKRLLEDAMQYEIQLQGELKRWLSGQPPSQAVPQRPPQSYAQEWQQPQAGPEGQPPAQGPQAPQTQAQQPSQAQPPLAPQQPQQPSPPQYFKGQTQQHFAPGDMRDPVQAQEFLRRAQEMPLANAAGAPPAPGQPVYQTQNAPGGYVQPPGVPVSMHYADPQAQAPAPTPVHFPSAEAAAAAVAASHHANQPIQTPANGAAKSGAS